MINFMKLRWLYFTLSLIVIIPGIISLQLYGLKPSIDFTGGSLLELSAPDGQQLTLERVEAAVQDKMSVGSVQPSGTQQYIIKGSELTNEQKMSVLESLTAEFGNVQELRFERVGATISNELLQKTLVGVAIVAVAITLFVSRQFKEWRYGVSAILAMLHDSLVLIGLFSLFGHFWDVQVDVLFVTALLTTLSFSVHDTIVVYDRIRELRRTHAREKLVTLVNLAVTETLSRSLNNSITIIVMLTSLVLLGGQTIQMFALALLIGAVTGTYSSTFTAAPLLLFWEKKDRSK